VGGKSCVCARCKAARYAVLVHQQCHHSTLHQQCYQVCFASSPICVSSGSLYRIK
jgi:hypothetical protein